MEALEDLLNTLDLDRLGQDRFRGGHTKQTLPFVFGGQVLAQALVAAGRTVEAGRAPHSLHGYFLLPGDPLVPIEFAVQRLRNGGTYSSRQVLASQGGRTILVLLASFSGTTATAYAAHQEYSAPVVPGPDDLQPVRYWLDPHRPTLPAWWDEPLPFDLRFVEEPTALTRGRKGLPRQLCWVRAEGCVPDDDLLQSAVVAFASDLTLLDPVLFPEGRSWYGDTVRGASLDHALWFHSVPKADRWLMFEQSGPLSRAGRGFSVGRISDERGTLVVSASQEGAVGPSRR